MRFPVFHFVHIAFGRFSGCYCEESGSILSPLNIQVIPLSFLSRSVAGLSTVCLCFLYWGVQNWTKHSRCGFTSVEQRQQGFYLPWQAVSNPTSCSPRFLAAKACCWLVFILLSTRTPKSFSLNSYTCHMLFLFPRLAQPCFSESDREQHCSKEAQVQTGTGGTQLCRMYLTISMTESLEKDWRNKQKCLSTLLLALNWLIFFLHSALNSLLRKCHARGSPYGTCKVKGRLVISPPQADFNRVVVIEKKLQFFF